MRSRLRSLFVAASLSVIGNARAGEPVNPTEAPRPSAHFYLGAGLLLPLGLSVDVGLELFGALTRASISYAGGGDRAFFYRSVMAGYALALDETPPLGRVAPYVGLGFGAITYGDVPLLFDPDPEHKKTADGTAISPEVGIILGDRGRVIVSLQLIIPLHSTLAVGQNASPGPLSSSAFAVLAFRGSL